MSYTNNNNQTQTSSALHNAIMEASGKDRPSMLALENPPHEFKWILNPAPETPATPDSDGDTLTRPKRVKDSYTTISEDLKNKFIVEAKAIQIILIGIDNDIYSTVDACPNAMEMWKTIERLKQGESIIVQDLKTSLFWEFGKFTSRDGETLDSYYSRFYKMMNELVRNQCIVTNHQVNVQFLLQLKPKWQRTANPLSLVATNQQTTYHPQTNPTHYTQSLSNRSQAATRNKVVFHSHTSPNVSSDHDASIVLQFLPQIVIGNFLASWKKFFGEIVEEFLESSSFLVMDPSSSVGKTCLGKNVIKISSDKAEGHGDWNSPEFWDTTNSGGKKETKAMVFHKMDIEEISDRFVAPCFVNGLEAYDGEINLGVEENMISNEFLVKLCLDHEVKRVNKVVKKELIVALRGEIYFVKFIINPKEYDVEPGVVFGRSFLRLTKAIAELRTENVTI
ncbi:hypothetical protein Tco_0167656 [Tanacetum coccineum]